MDLRAGKSQNGGLFPAKDQIQSIKGGRNAKKADRMRVGGDEVYR